MLLTGSIPGRVDDVLLGSCQALSNDDTDSYDDNLTNFSSTIDKANDPPDVLQMIVDDEEIGNFFWNELSQKNKGFQYESSFFLLILQLYISFALHWSTT